MTHILTLVIATAFAANITDIGRTPKIGLCPASYGGRSANGGPDLDDLVSSGQISAAAIKKLLHDFGAGPKAEESHFRKCITVAAPANLKNALSKGQITQEQYDRIFDRLRKIMTLMNDPNQRKSLGLPPLEQQGSQPGGGDGDITR